MTNNQDTYIAENDQVGDFVAYFCAALLMHWSADLKALDFQGIIVFLQSLPTDNWTLVEVRKLLLTAVLCSQSTDHASSSHLFQLETILSQAHLWRLVHQDGWSWLATS